jgi:hypothetical protein
MVARMPTYLLNMVRPMMDKTKILLPSNVYNKKLRFFQREINAKNLEKKKNPKNPSRISNTKEGRRI